jgi:high-affinity nickel permease
MAIETIILLFFAFLFGMQHALDADHVVAVSSLVSKHKSFGNATLCGIKWGIGHSLTLLIVGLVVMVFSITISPGITLFFEFIVGMIIIALGVSVLYKLFSKKIHLHQHEHSGVFHTHLHLHERRHFYEHNKLQKNHDHSPIIVGIVHGLAGSASLMLLVLSTLNSLVLGLFYLVIFGLGTIAGMTIISGLLSLPFVFTQVNFYKINWFIKYATGTFSVIFGFILIIRLVF